MNAVARFTMSPGDLELVEEPVEKFNPNHDEKGQFSSGSNKLTIIGKNDGENSFFNENTRVVRFQQKNGKPVDYVLYMDGKNRVVAYKKPTDGTTIDGYSESRKPVGILLATGPKGTAWRRSAEFDNKGTITDVKVANAHQRRGLASAMLQFHRDTYPELDIQHSHALTPDGTGWASVVKFNPNHDEKGQFASGNVSAGTSLSAVHDLQNFDPNAPIPSSPKNAGGMTAKIWDNWEHGPDGNQYVELYRQYAGEALGLQVPKSDMAPGGSENYLTQRGFGGSSTETAKGHAISILKAIENGSPTQPALYRGMTEFRNDPNSAALIQQMSNLKPGDKIDMPLVSTTRSLGVASWYAADRVSSGQTSVIMKIQPGAKGVSIAADKSWYPADHEVITSGKFEVVGVSHVKTPYWKRGILEPRKTEFTDGSAPHYEAVTYSSKQFSPVEAKKIWEASQTGNIQSLATDTMKFVADRRNPKNYSMWEKQPPTNFTVVEVKMVEPHSVKKSTDYGMTFNSLFNNRPFIDDSINNVEKFNPNHDELGRFSSGTGMGAGVATSILERVKANGGLSVNMVNGSEPQTGYMVAKGTDLGATVSAADFYDPAKGPKILADYMKKNKSDLGTGKNYLGLWHNTEDGNVYLDVSQNIQSKSEAITAGQLRDQISIWDVVNFAEIQTGGTGVTKQEVGSGGIADEHFRDDGRGDRSVRSNNLGEVSKTRVIYFAPGLKPVIKFNPYHDERGRFSTGTGYAQGGYTAEQTYRQNQMRGKGASNEAISTIMAADNHAFNSKDQIWKQMQQIYEAKTSGMTASGRKTSIETQITSIVSEYGRLKVTGNMVDSKSKSVIGQIQRTFYKDGNGNLCVEHDYLAIHNQYREEYKGFGLGKKIIANSEAYYANIGLHKITVGTAWDGARHWARAGYDWNPNEMKTNYAHLLQMAYHVNGSTSLSKPVVRKFNSLMKQMSPDYNPNNLNQLYDNRNSTVFHPMTNSKFPIPNDFATLGYTKGARNWAGKTLLDDVHMKYQKIVNSEGYNIKTTPATDRTGDGYLHTNSLRQKPALPNNN